MAWRGGGGGDAGTAEPLSPFCAQSRAFVPLLLASEPCPRPASFLGRCPTADLLGADAGWGLLCLLLDVSPETGSRSCESPSYGGRV